MIPVPLAEDAVAKSFSPYVTSLINEIGEYIVENEKTARKFLKQAGLKRPQSELIIHDYGKHQREKLDFRRIFATIKEGKDIGLMSEAGCPAIADPGSDIVAEAHRAGIKVVPLPGPNSILLALMASGFNGQKFAFQGYLPIDRKARQSRIRALEKEAEVQQQTQIFIETPFRNNPMLADLIENLDGSTMLCVAVDLTSATEQVMSKPVKSWRSEKLDLHKRPAVFIIHPRDRRSKY